VPVTFRGVTPAVLVDRSFILFNKVDKPAPSAMISALYHIGWGGIDGPSEYEWRNKKGARWQTELSTLGTNYYMYAYGPDDEVIEVWTGFQHERFGHVHLFSDDVAAAHKWYKENLGLDGPDRVAPKPPPAPKDFKAGDVASVFRYLWSSQVSSDDGAVTINIFAKPSNDTVNWWADPPVGELVPTDGRVIDHIAFSYRNIQPVFDRMKANGVEIVDGIKMRDDVKMKSFFVRGPDKILIEVCEAKPLPEGVWE
jgi:catechol 2,3-dioxygenase-like lactoylglutathione lyase family enzyme